MTPITTLLISALFIALGKSSPVCALLPQLDTLEELYQKLINNEPVKQSPHNMLLLQQSSPLLFDIISIIEGDQMPDVLCTLISDLLHKAKAPFGVNSLADGGSQNTSQAHDLEYFPALPVVRSRGDYSFDAISPNICTKRSSKHPSLLPGIFLPHCQRGRTKFTSCEIFVAILAMFPVRNASIHVNAVALDFVQRYFAL